MADQQEISRFIKEMSHYLASDRWLPFISPTRYGIREPSLYFPTSDKRYCVFTLERKDFFGNKGTPFGCVQIVPYFQDQHIRFKYLQTCYDHMRGHMNVKGVGREVVRRVVLYALERGFKKVTTAHCLNGASSFWLNLGFRAVTPLKPDWSQVNHSPKDVIEAWETILKVSPDAIWNLAQTEIGRRVLYWQSSKGELALEDGKQCSYAFQRLKLPYNFG